MSYPKLSYAKPRRRPELAKIAFYLIRGCLSLILLFAGYLGTVGRCLDAIQVPCIPAVAAGMFFGLNISLTRFLFLDDLISRRTQSGFRNAAWSSPSAGLYVLGSVVVFHIAIVLFGAPIFEHYLETLYLALLLSSLSFVPFAMIYAQPLDEVLKLVQSEKRDVFALEKTSLLPGLMAVVGAWSGAVVIPLDWDRPWQKWPIPCYYGALIAYAMCNLSCASILSWKSLRRPKFASKGE